MKKVNKIIVVIILITITTALFVGCKKDVTDIDMPSKGLGAAPALDFAEVAFDIGDIDTMDSDIDKAITLFTYASYNQIDAPYYHFLAHSSGDSIVGTVISQSVRVQVGLEYFHQVIIHVSEVKKPALKMLVGIVERARRRVNYNSVRYRYSGSNITLDKEDEKLLAAWKNPGKGESYTPEKGEYETLSNVDFSNRNAIKAASIKTVNTNGRILYQVTMEADVKVVNASKYSMDLLKDDTNANPVKYNYYTIEFEVWDTGHFRSIKYLESWEGKITGISGSSESFNYYIYSYDAEDCNLDAYIEMAEIPLKSS